MASRAVANGFFGGLGCLAFVILFVVIAIIALAWSARRDCSLDDPRCVDEKLRRAAGTPPAAPDRGAGAEKPGFPPPLPARKPPAPKLPTQPKSTGGLQ